MKQYCRYCAFCFEADDYRCSNHPKGKQPHWTEEQIKRPTYHKGKYGSKYDSWTCGNCGHGLAEPYWKFCPNCGYRVGRKIYGKRADQIIIDEVMEKGEIG